MTSTLNRSDIDRVVRTGKIISVSMEGGEYYVVNKDDFEDWANDEQKREWIDVQPDRHGEPQESGGTYTWDVYYHLERFENDILEFILKFKIPPKQ